jgi:hypothetical protein
MLEEVMQVEKLKYQLMLMRLRIVNNRQPQMVKHMLHYKLA